jgi:hypothetical protein
MAIGTAPWFCLTAYSVIQSQSGLCPGHSFSPLAFSSASFVRHRYAFSAAMGLLILSFLSFFPTPLGMLLQFGKSAVIVMTNACVGLAQPHRNLLEGVPLVETQT